MRNLLARAILFLAALSLLSGSPETHAQSADPDLRDAMDTYLQSLVESGFSGAVLVAREGEIILHEGYGMANDETQRPVEADTVFGFGSITKQFTAAAILHLEMQGLLSTADPITRYFDDVPAGKSAITIHQLLAHTSGLPSHVFAGDRLEIGRENAVRQILNQALLFEPGTDARYSDDAYKLLAAIAEIASGETWQSYLETHLFQPAGMGDTGFFGDPGWEQGRVANGYHNGWDEGPPNEWPRPSWALIGAGGVMTTVEDMFRWYRALQEGQILSSAALQKLWTPHAPIGGRSSFGYGWIIVETADQGTFVETTGAGSSHNAYFHATLEDGLVVIVASNRINEPALSWLGLVETQETLYAFEVGDTLVGNIKSGDFAPLPPFARHESRPLRPTTRGYAAAAALLLVIVIGARSVWRRKGDSS